MAEGNIVLISLYDLDSMAVRILHGVLKREGLPVHTVFFKEFNQQGMEPWIPQDVDALMGLLKDLKPAIVGVSVRSAYFHLAAEISRRVRAELDCLLVWGGSHVTANPRQSLDHADAVCVGEGEETLVELARRVGAGQSIEGIPNLWLKQDGAVIEQSPRPLVADLDTLPFTDYLNDNKYHVSRGQVLPMPGLETRLAHWIMTGRGCPYNCTYCCNNTLRSLYDGKGKYVRRRSVENVMQELHWAREHFPNLMHISFWDDVFSLDLSWMKRFHQRYKEEIGLPFFCYCHPKATGEEMIQLLRDAGVHEMAMGIQSGSERTRRDLYHRHEKNEDIVKGAEVLARHQVRCVFECIVENPAETTEDKRKTLELLLELPRPYELHIQAMCHFPGTDSTRYLLEKGLIQPEDVEGVKATSFERWCISLDETRPTEDLFWDNLYYMASQACFPKSLVIRLSHSRLLWKYPRLLTIPLRWTSTHPQTVRPDSKVDPVRVKVVKRLGGVLDWLREKSRPLRHLVGLKRSTLKQVFAGKGE